VGFSNDFVYKFLLIMLIIMAILCVIETSSYIYLKFRINNILSSIGNIYNGKYNLIYIAHIFNI